LTAHLAVFVDTNTAINPQRHGHRKSQTLHRAKSVGCK
jgi:hypothetical protein